MSNLIAQRFPASREKDTKEGKFNVKEVGYLLQLVEVGSHNGQALELALICKMKLQEMLDRLTNHTE